MAVSIQPSCPTGRVSPALSGICLKLLLGVAGGGVVVCGGLGLALCQHCPLVPAAPCNSALGPPPGASPIPVSSSGPDRRHGDAGGSSPGSAVGGAITRATVAGPRQSPWTKPSQSWVQRLPGPRSFTS